MKIAPILIGTLMGTALASSGCSGSSPSAPPDSFVHSLTETASAGRLTSRPVATPTESIGTGLHHLYLGVDTGRDGSIYVPQSYRPGHPAPLLLFFHGNRGDKTQVLELWQAYSEHTGTILLLPESRKRSWDRILDKAFGPDLVFVDQALKLTFAALSIDTKHMAVAGFSDGASYALSLGQTNGDLFTHIAAFSPGESAPMTRVGHPPVFIMHGIEDDILDINETSRKIVPELSADGYNVTYGEFHGQHLVIDEEKDKFFKWFLN